MTRALALLLAVALTACDQGPESTPTTGGQRIVALAPHLAELTYAVGAGDQLIGVSAYTDYPAEALDVQVVSDAFTVDHEALLLLRPDLVLVWESGMPESTVGQLIERGYPVRVIRTRSLADIENALRTIGGLTGHQAEGNAKADAFRTELNALHARYAEQQQLSAFYQISRDPLYTVNGEHYVSEILALCGAHNVFSDLAQLAPNIDVEAVLARNPQLIVASDATGVEAFDVWQAFPTIAAVDAGHLIQLPGDALGRPSPRVLDAARVACEKIAEARADISAR